MVESKNLFKSHTQLSLVGRYFDLQSKECKSIEGTLLQIFGTACHRLKISLNTKYNVEQESMRDTAKEIASQVVSEIDPDSLFGDYSRMIVSTENDRRFEDDVMTYLIIRSANLIDKPHKDRANLRGRFSESELSECLEGNRHLSNKRESYAAVGDFLFFSMAAGISEKSSAGKRRAAHAYWRAHAIEEESRGRGSARSEVYAKLTLRFPRYFAITEEAFQDAFFQTRLKPESIALSPEAALSEIDRLLEELSHISPENTEARAHIHARLKKLTGEN